MPFEITPLSREKIEVASVHLRPILWRSVAEQRVRAKTLRSFHLPTHNFRWCISVFFSARIAANLERLGHGQGCDLCRYGPRESDVCENRPEDDETACSCTAPPRSTQRSPTTLSEPQKVKTYPRSDPLLPVARRPLKLVGDRPRFWLERLLADREVEPAISEGRFHRKSLHKEVLRQRGPLTPT